MLEEEGYSTLVTQGLGNLLKIVGKFVRRGGGGSKFFVRHFNLKLNSKFDGHGPKLLYIHFHTFPLIFIIYS